LYIRAAIPVKTTLGAANYKVLMNMGMLFAFLVAALLIAWHVGKRSIADRVAVLESASQRMASGDLQVRVAGDAGGGELGNLGRNFDEMAAQIMVRDDEKNRLIDELHKAIADIKTLRGIIPICSSCKKIRNDAGVWTNLESYISEHTTAEFSHGICADCSKRLYPEYNGRKK
jgi:HAMP domain-containing protein